MPYEVMGYVHARVLSAVDRLRSEVGQGSVEYVGLILLVVALVGAAAAYANGHDGGVGKAIVGKVKDAIDGVKSK